MSFNVNKVLTDQEFDIIKAKILEISDKESINIGEFQANDMRQLVVATMNQWAKRMDYFLQVEERIAKRKYSPYYRLMMRQRGFTFKEYCRLFDSDLDEEDLLHYPAFEYLNILTHKQRKSFIFNKESDVESYVKTVFESDLEITKHFFLQKLSAIVAYSDLKKHAYISARIGTGKSEMMKLMFYNLQKRSQHKRNNGLILIDPHGDLAKAVKRFKLNTDFQRIAYIDCDLHEDFTPTINPFDQHDGTKKGIAFMTDFIVTALKQLIADQKSLSDTMEAFLPPCISTLLWRQGSTFIDLQRFMNDENNEDLVALGLKNRNPSHRNFFKILFHDRQFTRTKTAIANKIQHFLNYEAFRYLTVGQSTLHLEKSMNQGKVVIFKLPKGAMGDTASIAFGKLVVSMIEAIARKRESIPEQYRKQVFCFIDEFHNFTSPKLITILKESRKYGFGMVLANQTVGEGMDTDMKRNFLGNTQIKLIGANGHDSLNDLAKNTKVSIEDLKALKKYEFYVDSADKTPYKMQTTNFLTKTAFQLTDKQEEDLDQYLLYESGYYRPIEERQAPPPDTPDREPTPPEISNDDPTFPFDIAE